MGVELDHLIIAGRVQSFAPALGRSLPRWLSLYVRSFKTFCYSSENYVLVFIGGVDLLAITYLMFGSIFSFVFRKHIYIYMYI